MDAQAAEWGWQTQTQLWFVIEMIDGFLLIGRSPLTMNTLTWDARNSSEQKLYTVLWPTVKSETDCRMDSFCGLTSCEVCFDLEPK